MSAILDEYAEAVAKGLEENGVESDEEENGLVLDEENGLVEVGRSNDVVYGEGSA